MTVSSDTTKRNVILIVCDTLRQDFVGTYNTAATAFTPNLSRLGGQSVVLTELRPASFPTVPVRADLLTGFFSWLDQGWGPMPAYRVPLVSCFADAGYDTMGVADTPFLATQGYGYDRGFADFVQIRGQLHTSRSAVTKLWRFEEDHFAPQTFLTAERWLLDHLDRPFFLYVDTWDPHEPWDPPEYYIAPSAHGRTATELYPVYGQWKEAGLSERDLSAARELYRAKICMVDRWLGRLLTTVAISGLNDRTIVVFVSDHGFYFGEHGFFGKALWEGKRGDPGTPVYEEFGRSPLYEELLRVPALFRIPGVKPRRIETPMTFVDIGPTLAELTGVELGVQCHGTSFAGCLTGDARSGRSHVTSSWPLVNPGASTRVVDGVARAVKVFSPITVRSGKWALLYSSAHEPVELYDLADDPGQIRNVALANESVVADLHSRLLADLESYGAASHLVEPRRAVASA
ncbi:MAG: sulfatase [Candidatus Dormibacteria bacterium]